MAKRPLTGTTSFKIVHTIGMLSGVKVLSILCALVRNKLIAWLIGPMGLGLVMLYNTTVDLISQSVRLSVDQSAQRDISQASESGKAVIVTVVRSWSLWLGIAGSAVMCALSPLLSWWSFDTVSKWYVFCILSVVPFFLTYSSCTAAQNQGLRRFKQLAMANVLATIVGLVTVIPLIIWLRIDSVLWIIVLYGFSSWLGAAIFRPRLKSVDISRRETVEKGKSFIRLGVKITVALVITQLLNYVFVLFLNDYGSTGTLGIYQAGYTMMNSYIGIIFTSLWSEYFPRLSAISHSPRRMSVSVSHELKLTLALIVPLLIVLVLLVRPVIVLIYSADFLAIAPYMVLGCVGVLFRLTSFCMAYVILARGDGKTYLVTETLSSVTGLALNVAGFILGGFFGLGLAYILWYLVYTLIVGVVCARRYKVRYSLSAWSCLLGAVVLVAATCLLYFYFLNA